MFQALYAYSIASFDGRNCNLEMLPRHLSVFDGDERLWIALFVFTGAPEDVPLAGLQPSLLVCDSQRMANVRGIVHARSRRSPSDDRIHMLEEEGW